MTPQRLRGACTSPSVRQLNGDSKTGQNSWRICKLVTVQVEHLLFGSHKWANLKFHLDLDIPVAKEGSALSLWRTFYQGNPTFHCNPDCDTYLFLSIRGVADPMCNLVMVSIMPVHMSIRPWYFQANKDCHNPGIWWSTDHIPSVTSAFPCFSSLKPCPPLLLIEGVCFGSEYKLHF